MPRTEAGFFAKFPIYIRKNIEESLTPKNIIDLYTTNPDLCGLYANEFQLLQHIENGEEANIVAMLEADPTLRRLALSVYSIKALKH